MFTVYYMEGATGDAPYLRPPALHGAGMVADAWTAYIDQKSECRSNPAFSPGVEWFSRWPGLYVKTVKVKYDVERLEAVYGPGVKMEYLNLMNAVVNNNLNAQDAYDALLNGGRGQEMPFGAGAGSGSFVIDESTFSLALVTIEKLCTMGSTIPTFLPPQTRDLSIGRMVVLLQECLGSITSKLKDEITEISPEVLTLRNAELCRQAATTCTTALKAMVKVGSMPPEELYKFNSTGCLIIGDANEDLAKMVWGYGSTLGLITAFLVDEKVPCGCDNEVAAVVLGTMHALRKLPAHVKHHPSFLGRFGDLCHVVEMTSRTKLVIGPGDADLTSVVALEEAVIQHIIAMMANSVGSRGGDTSPAWSLRKSQLLAVMTKTVKELKEAKSIIDGVEFNEEEVIERAIKKAEVLAVRPCAYLGCATLSGLLRQAPSKKCAGCKVVRYCSLQCQKFDWKAHKMACKALTERMNY